MKKKVKFLIFILIGIIVIFAVNYFCFTNKYTICKIVNNPTIYLSKAVTVEGILNKEGKLFLSDDFFLINNNCRINVASWAPYEAMSCPPGAQDCNPPKTMYSFLDDKIKLSGILKERPKTEYINNAWIKTGIEYYISEINNVITIKDNTTK